MNARELTNVGVLRELTNVGVLRELTNVGVLRELTNVGELRELTNVGELRELTNVGELRELTNVGVLREVAYLLQVRECFSVGLHHMQSIPIFAVVLIHDPEIHKPDPALTVWVSFCLSYWCLSLCAAAIKALLFLCGSTRC